MEWPQTHHTINMKYRFGKKHEKLGDNNRQF